MVIQEELKLERTKNEPLHDLAQLSNSHSMTSNAGSESSSEIAPGSRLKEALSIISALRQSLRT
jgi:hypothetical protein